MRHFNIHQVYFAYSLYSFNATHRARFVAEVYSKATSLSKTSNTFSSRTQ